MSRGAKSGFGGVIFMLILNSIIVTGLSASLVAKDHHDGVAIAHLVIALVLIPLGWLMPLSVVCWLGALLTLVSVPSSRHILASQWSSQINSSSSLGQEVAGAFDLGNAIQTFEAWAHGPYVGLCVCDISGILLGVVGIPAMIEAMKD